MDFLEELEQAERDAFCSFTQDQWEDALIEAHKKNHMIWSVLVALSGLTRKLTSKDWEALTQRASELKPSLHHTTSVKRPVQAWLAAHAPHASDAMWDGDYAKAKKLITKGGYRASSLTEARRVVKKEERENSGFIYAGTRGKDKRRDWKTCK